MYLFAALINGGSQFYWLAIIGVLNSVISLYYYISKVSGLRIFMFPVECQWLFFWPRVFLQSSSGFGGPSWLTG
jgi:hypothetical protein